MLLYTTCIYLSRSAGRRWARAARAVGVPVQVIPGESQNTDSPRVVPDGERDCVEAVRVQLESLQNPNDPWPNHGIHMAYTYAYDVGGLDPSMYFGYPTDLCVFSRA